MNSVASFWFRYFYPQRIKWEALLYSLCLIVGATTLYADIGFYLDDYEKIVFSVALFSLALLGVLWQAWRFFFYAVCVCALSAIELYQGHVDRALSVFWLRYLLASQTSVLWMGLLFFMATIVYWWGLWTHSPRISTLASALTWAAAACGFSSLLTRWYESYLLSSEMGHIPLSNLYEVFVLFCVFTALLYLYYEGRYQAYQLGAFVLLVISAAVGFILWYAIDRQAHDIQPLIPALQSWWMKIHVPANFIGYAAFSIAAMLGVAQLLALNGLLLGKLPSSEQLDEMMYRCMTLGFLFFTLATLLGALWAADAWGGYWSWDPKETWALIVWLNYAAWLHMRLVYGRRSKLLAWWAVIGLVITSFAFLGVNVFLSGLHSYGAL